MINKAILVGNVGNEPDVRFIDKDVPVASFRLATTERAFSTASGVQVPERTEWHNIVAWRGLARLAENHIHKGTQLYIEGKITYRSYTDKNNITRYTTEIVADTIQLLGRRRGEEETPGREETPAPAPAVNDLPPTGTANDDLPF
ncbi:MAG: single-stranded DNA-binding protein [Bacteroidales bacterium]|nr:single-stranded DNA-binding protein [Bacteroidales bacterium]